VRPSEGKEPQTNIGIARNVRSILDLKHLTLSQVSQRSKVLYGDSSPFVIPHNFYYDLRVGNVSPSIHQLAAFSFITGFRLHDWLRVFGADLENIVRSQVALPSPRTIILDSSLEDSYSRVPWFRNRTGDGPVPAIAPLRHLVISSTPRRIRSFPGAGKSRFIYVKVGSNDALAFPVLVPGSIVRVNTDVPDEVVPRTSRPSRRYFLIEHEKGLFCCQLRAIGDTALVPVSPELSYAQIELHRPRETRLVGVADLEIRPLAQSVPPSIPAQLARRWKPAPLRRETRIGPMLRRARMTARMSLREASAASRRIAETLQDGGYFLSPSSLCDYELLNTTPRRFQTVLTLCSVYGIGFRALLRAIGIDLDQTGTAPIPDALAQRESHLDPQEDFDGPADEPGFLAELLGRCGGEVPFFLRQSIESISGLGAASLDDIFWIGGEREALHPYLANGLLAVVNRRRRRPVHFPSQPLWQQPIYIVLKRDGNYLCGCCGIENGTLVIHPYSQDFHRTDVFRYRHDAEVVGQIVAIARKLS